MAARVICVASAKGGSGKTVLTASMGRYLATVGKRVLLVDTDAATNGLSLLYLNEVVAHRDQLLHGIEKTRNLAIPLGIFEIAREGVGVGQTVALADQLDLLPATYSFLNTEQVEVHEFRRALASALEAARDNYDFVFLDAQAGADDLAALSMGPMMSDAVVLVSEYDPLSAAGVERLKSLFPSSLTFDRTWILLNKVLPELSSALGEFLQVARYLSPIPWTADVARAYAQRRLALDLERGNDYTLAITEVVKGLADPGLRADVDEWLASKATALKEPLRAQIDDLEAESEGLLIELAQYENRQRILKLFFPVLLALMSTIVVVLIAFEDVSSTVSAGVLAGSVASVALALGLQSRENVQQRVGAAKVRRRELIVEERLKRLQTMVEAEPEELLRLKD